MKLQPVHPRFRPLLVVLLFLSFLLAGYWWFSFSGLFALIANIQISLFKGYDLFLTGVLTLIGTLVPVLAFSFLLPRANEPLKNITPAQQKQLYRKAVKIIVPVIFGISGFYFLLSGIVMGNYQEYSIASIKTATDLKTRYVGIRGPFVKADGFATTETTNSGKNEILYFPLQSRDDENAHIILKVSYATTRPMQQKLAKAMNDGIYKGTISFEKAAELKAFSMTAIDEDAAILELGKEPREDMILGEGFLIIAGLWVGGVGIWKKVKSGK